MKYSFKQQDMNNWKGRITESLTGFFIRDVLAPKLEKSGWDKVLFIRTYPDLLQKPSKLKEKSPSYLRSGYRDRYKWFKRFLLARELCFPDQELLDEYKELGRLSEHAPDGLLLKLRKTNKTKSMDDIISDLGMGKWSWSNGETQFELELSGRVLMEIPIVTGEIEVVEVKSDKGKLSRVQKDHYSSLVKNGYPLRLFHVRIVSFDKNHFEVKEKLLRTINEIEKGLRTL